MQIKTEKGIGEGMPLTDIQEYNIQLAKNTEALLQKNQIDKFRNAIEVWKWLIIFLIITIFVVYVKYNNILNNIVARCM